MRISFLDEAKTPDSSTHKMSKIEFGLELIPKLGNNNVMSDYIAGIQGHDHPNIQWVVEAFEDQGQYYLIQEKCYGGDLLEKLMEKVQLEEDETKKIIK